jgi:hypothetical protein
MSGARKQIDVARVKADVTAASVELLSAHCATDRIRLQYSLHDIVAFGERNSLRRAIDSAEALYRFFPKSRPTSRARGESIRRIFVLVPAFGTAARGNAGALPTDCSS